jgi:hypothetical protein
LIDPGATTLVSILGLVAAGRELVGSESASTLTIAEYNSAAETVDSARSGHGATSWPPAHATVSNRLGGGSWPAAMTTLGLDLARRGPRVRYSDADVDEALKQFSADSELLSVAAYNEWLDTARGAGKPSASHIISKKGTWRSAIANLRPQTATPRVVETVSAFQQVNEDQQDLVDTMNALLQDLEKQLPNAAEMDRLSIHQEIRQLVMTIELIQSMRAANSASAAEAERSERRALEQHKTNTRLSMATIIVAVIAGGAAVVQTIQSFY